MPATARLLDVGFNSTDRAHIPATRVCLGGGRMKLRTLLNCVAAAIAAASLTAGCGSKSAVNTVTVAVISSVGTSIIVGQSTTLTALVTGGTTTTPSTPANCPTDGTLGALSNQEATGTATYTAPTKIPDQTKYPGLQIIITAQSQQDTSKTGKWRSH